MKIYELDIDKIDKIFDEMIEEFVGVKSIIAVNDCPGSDFGYSLYFLYEGSSTYLNFASDEFCEEEVKKYLKKDLIKSEV